MMKRVEPNKSLYSYPCSITAVSCAKGNNHLYIGNVPEHIGKDGYVTLKDANRYIRDSLHVKKRIDYKRGQRPLLNNLHIDGKAIICVLGHFLYADGETYYSFFDNENDEVVAVWLLK